MTYEVICNTEGREISWETKHAQTANKWFWFIMRTGRTIDTGTPVSACQLKRDGKLMQSWRRGS